MNKKEIRKCIIFMVRFYTKLPKNREIAYVVL